MRLKTNARDRHVSSENHEALWMQTSITDIVGLVIFSLFGVQYLLFWLTQWLLLQESKAEVTVRDWLEIFTRLGVPVAFLLGLVWFLYKAVWPFIVKRFEEAEASRKAEIEKFAQGIRESNQTHAAVMDKVVAAFQTEMRELRNEIIRKSTKP